MSILLYNVLGRFPGPNIYAFFKGIFDDETSRIPMLLLLNISFIGFIATLIALKFNKQKFLKLREELLKKEKEEEEENINKENNRDNNDKNNFVEEAEILIVERKDKNEKEDNIKEEEIDNDNENNNINENENNKEDINEENKDVKIDEDGENIN